MVRVDWDDSSWLPHGWHAPKNVRRGPVNHCRSVGFLVHRGRRWLSVASADDGYGRFGLVQRIPRAAVRGVHRLEP